MRTATFRWAMLIAATALLIVGLFYLIRFWDASIAFANSGMQPFYRQTARALWLGFCLQAGLLAVLFSIAALHPRAISRPMLVICGLMPICQGVLMLTLMHSLLGLAALTIATLALLTGAMLWPSAESVAAADLARAQALLDRSKPVPGESAVVAKATNTPPDAPLF